MKGVKLQIREVRRMVLPNEPATRMAVTMDAVIQHSVIQQLQISGKHEELIKGLAMLMAKRMIRELLGDEKNP